MSAVLAATRHDRTAPPPAGTPKAAMILAAGLGKRMLPLTEHTPKPLVRVHGKHLIDYAIEALVAAGVGRIVVNVHHLAASVESHLRQHRGVDIVVSDERTRLLDSGGGMAKALPHFEGKPFFLLNADSFWIEGFRPNLHNMAAQWDRSRMDMLLLLAGMASTVGYGGLGDFTMDPEGRLSRRRERHAAPFVYAGAAIIDPGSLGVLPEGPFSLNLLFDRALERERLFGVRLDGLWFHVGTPDSIIEAEEAIARSSA